MIIPLVTVWASAQLDPAPVGITGLALATGAWLALEAGQGLVDARRAPSLHHRAVVDDARTGHGRPRALTWADQWAIGADTPPPCASRGEALRFVVALTGLFDHPARTGPAEAAPWATAVIDGQNTEPPAPTGDVVRQRAGKPMPVLPGQTSLIDLMEAS